MTLTQDAIAAGGSPAQVAATAVREAVEAAETDAEKEALALQFFREATGRFPQDSADRRAVYTGGYILVGIVFLATVIAAVIVILSNKQIPDWLATLATALGSGIIGGLFGYAQQT